MGDDASAEISSNMVSRAVATEPPVRLARRRVALFRQRDNAAEAQVDERGKFRLIVRVASTTGVEQRLLSLAGDKRDF